MKNVRLIISAVLFLGSLFTHGQDIKTLERLNAIKTNGAIYI